MSRWFRHYAGMMRDDKMVRVALKSGQTIERVLWIWGAILESAAEIDDGGRYDLDEVEVAYFLRANEEDVSAVLAALKNAGRINRSRVTKWSERQFQSDRSAARVAAYRERKRGKTKENTDVSQRSGNVDVTLHDRYGNAPETETDTEVTLDKSSGAGAPSDKLFWDNAKAYLGPSSGSLIGKWSRDYGKPETAAAITAAQLERAADPKSYIIGILRKGARANEPVIGI